MVRRIREQIAARPTAFALSGIALAVLALVWAVRDTPWQALLVLRFDGLSAFFLFVTTASLALLAWSLPQPDRPTLKRWGACLALVSLAYSAVLLPVIVAAYAGLALLLRQRPGGLPVSAPSTEVGDTRLFSPAGLSERVRRVRWSAWAPTLAAACLLLGYGLLVLRGALRYDERIAGAAFDSLVFWFVLLGAIIPQLAFDEQDDVTHGALIWRIAWLYPLVRLYSLGSWNSGWSFATLLLAGSAALWLALTALTRPSSVTRTTSSSYLALALAGFGLGTGAGVAAGCYGVLAALVVGSLTNDGGRTTEDGGQGDKKTEELQATDHGPQTTDHEPISTWLLSGALPFTAPFIATWMLIGAATAGGVIALAGVVWFVALLSALTLALRGWESATHRSAAGASAAFGVAAPLVLLILIEPVILQLQDGLTPYGDVNIWPWIGIAVRDSANVQVATLPSIAVAVLMLVLTALVYLASRLYEQWRDEPAAIRSVPAQSSQAAAPSRFGAIVAFLRNDVPWLGSPKPPSEHEQRPDNE
jgi:hypothetical protein